MNYVLVCRTNNVYLSSMSHPDLDEIHDWLDAKKRLNKWSFSSLADLIDMSSSGIHKAFKMKTLSLGAIQKIVDYYELSDEFNSLFSTKSTFIDSDNTDFQGVLCTIPVDEIMIYLSQNRKEKFEGNAIYEMLKQIIQTEHEASFFEGKYKELMNKLESQS